MEFKENIQNLLAEALSFHPDLFLIDLHIDNQSRVQVVLDGDHGVSLEQCIKVSRHIEHQLDREVHDFSLEVSSSGATHPLQMVRQYKKNIGRKLAVHTTDNDNYKAILKQADDEQITLEWKAREPKPIGKGKHTVVKQLQVPYNQIEKATVQIQFK
ncbi:MAG: ribosome assembly cofactor RimP [Flavobacteriaceae bacterium]|nr:ribosome assembly cofactor RimP [Flavobacteriaceae bacterium]|tara:strand:- start:6581 stop:7051 length:471 start_codon:yes stop_codon:yes gene_type:complete